VTRTAFKKKNIKIKYALCGYAQFRAETPFHLQPLKGKVFGK